MNALGRFSIRTRLYFGTVFSLILLIVIGAMGFVALDRSRGTLQELFSQRVQTLTDMSDLRTTLGEVRQVQSGDAEFVASIDKSLDEIKQYETGIAPIFEKIEGAQLDGAGGGAYADRLKVHMEATDKLFSSLASSARSQMDEARAGVESRTSTMSALIGIGLVLGLAVLIPLTFFSVRSITKSLGQAQELADRIASGDLSRDVAAMNQDEVGQLVSAMGRMQDALRGLVRQVQDAAGNITTASSEIASGNHDLSHRTEQPSAQSSRQASDFASSAAEVAARGGAVVSQVVTTMDQITTSSRKIAD